MIITCIAIAISLCAAANALAARRHARRAQAALAEMRRLTRH